MHPSAPENGVDEVDDDCDGSVLVHRIFVSSMNSAFTGSDFTVGAAGGTTTVNGWNTAWPTTGTGDFDMASYAMDQLPWALAWDGESPVFQDATVRAVAVCPGCDQETGGLRDIGLVAGVADRKTFRFYGAIGAEPRAPASRSCEAHMLTPTGADVSIWADESAELSEAWMPMIPPIRSIPRSTSAKPRSAS